MLDTIKKYYCPCCGYKTLSYKPPGTFLICEICYWEDDNIQFQDSLYSGGANKVSLIQGQKNFIKFGAIEEHFAKNVRKPNETDVRFTNWKKF